MKAKFRRYQTKIPKFNDTIWPRKKMDNVLRFRSAVGTTTTTDASPPSAMRWRAEITYSNADGSGSFATHFFEEISELHDIIERGPDWGTLIKCLVMRNLPPNAANDPLTGAG